MAQYIQTPNFSYEPLPMEAYMELAQKVAAGYAEGVSSANNYLSTLPISTGALDDPDGQRANQFRDQYGQEVQNAIDLYVNTKDKRSLASALTNITRKMQSDEKLLAHNYVSAISEDLLKRHQDNPNGWYAYTLDNSADLFKIDENGNRVSNIRPFTGGLGEAKNFYGSYLSGFDIANDTKWIDSFATNIESSRGEGTLNTDTGKIEYGTSEKKYSNLLDYWKSGEPSQEFKNSAKAVYDSGSNAMVRYYRQAYGDAAGLEKFIEDSFKYKYPSAYAKETGIGETAPGELSDAARAAAAAQQTALPTVDMYSSSDLTNVYSVLQDPNLATTTQLPANIADSIKEYQRQVAEGALTGNLEDLKEKNPQLYENILLATQVAQQAQIEEAYRQTPQGQREYNEYTAKKETEAKKVAESSPFIEAALDAGLNIEDLDQFNAAFYSIDKQAPSIIYRAKGNFGLEEMARTGKYFVPTAEALQDKYDRSSSIFWSIYDNFIKSKGSYVQEPETLASTELTLDNLVEQGLIDTNTEKGKKLYNFLKGRENSQKGSTTQAYESNSSEYFNSIKDNNYSKNLSDMFRSSEISSLEILIKPSVEVDNEIVDKKFATALARDIKNSDADEFLSEYDIYTYNSDIEGDPGTPTERAGSEKLNTQAFEEGLQQTAINAEDKKDLAIVGAVLPSSPMLKGGIRIKSGDTSYLLVPKDPNNDKYTKWMKEVKTSIAGKPVYPFITSGPLQSMFGESAADIMTRSNTYAEAGLISMAGISKDFDTFNAAASRVNVGINNAPLKTNKAVPVMTLDLSDPATAFTVSGGKVNVAADMSIALQKEDGDPLTWENYFDGFDQSNDISMFEMAALARSMAITNDYDQREVETFIGEIYQQAQPNAEGIKTIKGKDFNDKFKEEFGAIPDFTKGIVFKNHVDAIDFYNLDTGKVRKKAEAAAQGEEAAAKPTPAPAPAPVVEETPEVASTTPAVPTPPPVPTVSDQRRATEPVQRNNIVTSDTTTTTVAIPPDVVESTVIEIVEDENATVTEEVAKDAMVDFPELVTNPLEIAATYLGIEETDPAQYETIAGFYESAISDTSLLAKTPKALATEKAWCAAFANYVLNKVGFDTKTLEDYSSQPAYARVRARNFINYGEPVYNKSDKKSQENLEKARLGDIVVKKGPEGYHVGFYAGINPENPDEVLILGGNQNDQVNVTGYPLSEIETINRLANIGTINQELIDQISSDIKTTDTTR